MMREWPYTAQVAIYWVVQPLEASGDMSQLLKEIGFVNSQVLPKKNGIIGIHYEYQLIIVVTHLGTDVLPKHVSEVCQF